MYNSFRLLAKQAGQGWRGLQGTVVGVGHRPMAGAAEAEGLLGDAVMSAVLLGQQERSVDSRGRSGRAAEVETKQGIEPTKGERWENTTKYWLQKIHFWLDSHSFIHSFIHTFTQKHLFIDFLSSGAVRSLDKATEDLSGEVTYPRSHRGKSPGAHLLHSTKFRHVPCCCAQHSLWVVKASGWAGQSCQEQQPLPDSKGSLVVTLASPETHSWQSGLIAPGFRVRSSGFKSPETSVYIFF